MTVVVVDSVRVPGGDSTCLACWCWCVHQAIIETNEVNRGYADNASEEAKGRDEGASPSKKGKGRRLRNQGTQYLYCGKKLVRGSGKVFGDYPFDTQLKRWSKPYAGVVWICRNYVEPGFARSRRKKKGKP